MPRGRYWYGPGFWKRNTGWVPGSGGFRVGAYGYAAPGGSWFRGPGPCRWFEAGYAPYPPWMAEPTREEEARALKEHAEAIKAELKEIEQRLAELQEEQQSE